MNRVMVEQKSWNEFRKCGLVWFINRTLHLFGWAIVIETNDKEEITDVYPARCKYRGFTKESEDKGFKNLTLFLKDNIKELEEDLEL
jgi:hypothetical protein